MASPKIRTTKQLRDMLDKVEALIPEGGYETSFRTGLTSCTITFKVPGHPADHASGPSFVGLAAHGPLIVRDLLHQLLDNEKAVDQ